METQFTWIAFYKELAQKLLPYTVFPYPNTFQNGTTSRP